jgi:hypothetical protein
VSRVRRARDRTRDKRARPAGRNRRRQARADGTCSSKARHRDLDLLTARIAARVERDGVPRAIYLCHRCGLYHVTRDLDGRDVVRKVEIRGEDDR